MNNLYSASLADVILMVYMAHCLDEYRKDNNVLETTRQEEQADIVRLRLAVDAKLGARNMASYGIECLILPKHGFLGMRYFDQSLAPKPKTFTYDIITSEPAATREGRERIVDLLIKLESDIYDHFRAILKKRFALKDMDIVAKLPAWKFGWRPDKADISWNVVVNQLHISNVTILD